MACTIEYGALYNWYAVTDPREICSSGWHVPTYQEHLILRNYLDPINNNHFTNVAGGLMKETGTTYWTTPNTGASNSVGFNAKGSGYRIFTGVFNNLNEQFIMWAGNSDDPPSGGRVGSIVYDDDYFQSTTYLTTPGGASIRPLKDSTTLSDGEEGTYTGNDGKLYRTICIGTQEWLADNLWETKYRNGDDIPIVTDNATWAGLATGAMCYYNNDINNAGVCTPDGFCINAKYIKFCTPAFVPGPLASDVRAYWKLDEVVGNIAADSSVYGYNGFIQGDTTLGVTGILNSAMSFDGSGDYIDCGATVGDVGTNDFSLSGWVRLDSSVNTYNGICGNYGSYPHFYITIGNGFDDYVVAKLVIDAFTEVSIFSDGGLNVGQWYYITVTYDRSGLMRMYIDSVLQFTTGDISSHSAVNITNVNTFNLATIGSAQIGYFGDLTLDSWGLWTKVLSQGEIDQLYNSGTGWEYPFSI